MSELPLHERFMRRAIALADFNPAAPFAPCHLIGGVLEAECDLLFRRAMRVTGGVSNE